MPSISLLSRSLIHYWRTNLAVVLGVAVAVAVLIGSLLVGDSVRGSLRELALQRLGKTGLTISSKFFFREMLAEEIASHPLFSRSFSGICPVFVSEGWVTHPDTGRRTSRVAIYGVDERFWNFHDVSIDQQWNSSAFGSRRQAFISPEIARDLNIQVESHMLLRMEQPSNIPRDSLHGRRDRTGRTLRLVVSGILQPAQLGEFSLRSQQGSVRSVFVPLRTLQRDLNVENRVNTLLVSNLSGTSQVKDASTTLRKLSEILQQVYRVEDTGLKIQILEHQQCLSLEAEGTLLKENLVVQARKTATHMKLQSNSFFTYLANTIRAKNYEIPYSLVTALDFESFGLPKKRHINGTAPPNNHTPIVLNEWAAHDLQVQPNDLVELDYYVWMDQGQLVTQSAKFQLADVVPMDDLISDRNLTPDYPGVSESKTLVDWDPPFPMALGRIRSRDEQYWEKYRTTPKAFIPLEAGQKLWGSRYGQLTALRLYPHRQIPGLVLSPESLSEMSSRFKFKLRTSIDPKQLGFSLNASENQALRSSQGATDFGHYFVYFSFFLVTSALLLTGLFFKLGLEHRIQEIGLLKSLGFPPSTIRNLFLREGAVLAALGTIFGLAGALGYTALIMLGLRTWWVEAVGTTLLTLHVSSTSLAAGASAGVLVALSCIAWTLRNLLRFTPRSLLTGSCFRDEHSYTSLPSVTGDGRLEPFPNSVIPITSARRPPPKIHRNPALLIISLMALLLLFANMYGHLSHELGFFGAGTLLLLALLVYQSKWLRKTRRQLLQIPGRGAISSLGFRNATIRPSRSLSCIALIASATFILVTVEAFRRGDRKNPQDKQSGTGGFSMVAESLLPIHFDLNTPDGRESLNLSLTDNSSLNEVTFRSFRLRPGDDISCLNLYQPASPRILGAPDSFLKSARFQFEGTLEKVLPPATPWELLRQELPDGAIPVFADANSMRYVLHLKLGDEFILNGPGPLPVRLRLVGALKDSVFQSEFIMSEKHFIRAFSDIQGFRFFLLETSLKKIGELTAVLENQLSDFGFDVVPTTVKLSNFDRVENTYLSTFQALGGLGLLLGTLGLGTVLLRNVLERRKELALLVAVGYNAGHLTWLVVAENLLLLGLGLITGGFSAMVAIVPAYQAIGGNLKLLSLVGLLLVILFAGLGSSLAAIRAITRSPLLPALKTD